MNDSEESSNEMIDRIEGYRALVKENICYDALMQSYRYAAERRQIDAMVETIVELAVSPRKSVMIKGVDVPYELVKSRLLKVDAGCIDYVMEQLQKGTEGQRNAKGYLISCLFNAPTSKDLYYQAQVNEDRYLG